MAKKKRDKLDEVLDSLTEDTTAEELLKDGSVLKCSGSKPMGQLSGLF